MSVQAVEVTANTANGFGYVELLVSELDGGDDVALAIPARMEPNAAREVALGILEAAIRAEMLEAESDGSCPARVATSSAAMVCDLDEGHIGPHEMHDTATVFSWEDPE